MSSDATASNSTGVPAELLLAKWIDRFFAWLIDFVIVNTVLWAVFAALALPFWLNGAPDRWFSGDAGPATWAVTSLVFFVYWIYFESTSGQSLGKMALRIRTTDLSGNKPDIRNVAIQSFGKAFLLPVDLILGWIFTNDKRQRIFNRAANTIVIKGGQEQNTANIRYVKE